MKRWMILAMLAATAAGLLPGEASANNGSWWEPRPPRAAVAAVRG
jgi:hypothetical protein